jgi:hypothetical protein
MKRIAMYAASLALMSGITVFGAATAAQASVSCSFTTKPTQSAGSWTDVVGTGTVTCTSPFSTTAQKTWIDVQWDKNNAWVTVVSGYFYTYKGKKSASGSVAFTGCHTGDAGETFRTIIGEGQPYLLDGGTATVANKTSTTVPFAC